MLKLQTDLHWFSWDDSGFFDLQELKFTKQHESTYSQNWNLDSILSKIASFDFKNDAVLSFYGNIDSFFLSKMAF